VAEGRLQPRAARINTQELSAIDRLIARLQALMASHFATDALRWYWGDDYLRIRSRIALDGPPMDSMLMAEQRPLPEWARAIGNSRLLLSQTGAGFLIDAGYQGTRPKLDEFVAKGMLKTVEGIWITHYHDDHTDFAQELATHFHCSVYFTPHLVESVLYPLSAKSDSTPSGLVSHRGASCPWVSPAANDIAPLRGPI
jgi:beta-lactamase superfamily II metal-dependent hydrolase